MKKTQIPHAVGPLFTLSNDDETAIYDYTCFPAIAPNNWDDTKIK